MSYLLLVSATILGLYIIWYVESWKQASLIGGAVGMVFYFVVVKDLLPHDKFLALILKFVYCMYIVMLGDLAFIGKTRICMWIQNREKQGS